MPEITPESGGGYDSTSHTAHSMYDRRAFRKSASSGRPASSAACTKGWENGWLSTGSARQRS